MNITEKLKEFKIEDDWIDFYSIDVDEDLYGLLADGMTPKEARDYKYNNGYAILDCQPKNFDLLDYPEDVELSMMSEMKDSIEIAARNMFGDDVTIKYHIRSNELEVYRK